MAAAILRARGLTNHLLPLAGGFKQSRFRPQGRVKAIIDRTIFGLCRLNSNSILSKSGGAPGSLKAYRSYLVRVKKLQTAEAEANKTVPPKAKATNSPNTWATMFS